MDMTEGFNPTHADAQPRTPEIVRKADVAFLLDVDGVVTDPTEKKVVDTAVFDRMIENLTAGNPVALNTGRSNEWMIDRVINPLASRITDKSILNNFFAVGEKGLTWTSFNGEGKLLQGVFNRQGIPVEGYDLSVFLDKETAEHFKTLSDEAKQIIAKEYSHSTFFDATKKAMVSTEMHDGFNQPQYAAEQTKFEQELNAILDRLGLAHKFRVDPTTIATDIQLTQVDETDASGKVIAKHHVGKHLGTKRILRWLQLNKIDPQLYIGVGDSSSDLEMEDELTKQKKNNLFWYVNPQKPLKEEQKQDADKKPKQNLRFSKEAYSKGLLEVFSSVKKAA